MKCGMEIGWYVAAMVDEIAKAWMEGAWGYLNQRDRGQLMGAPGNTKLKSLGQCRRHPYSGDWGTNPTNEKEKSSYRRLANFLFHRGK
jgi:hypothetical protein